MQKGTRMEKTNINEAVDLHLLDLQEATRRDDVYNDLNEIVDKLQNMTVFPSLLWLWTFDIIRDIHENNQEPQEFIDEVVPAGITLKQIFDKFWEDVDFLGITMDNGGEIIEEVIRDWMRENDFLVALEEDGWLNEPNTFGYGVERGYDV
jgi:hypothetical protein